MEKGKQLVIVDDEEPKHYRVICYFKNVLYILRRFFRFVEEHPDVCSGIANVERDVVLLQAFLSHGAKQFDEDVDDTLEQIRYFAHEAAMIISEYDLDKIIIPEYDVYEMSQYKTWQLERRVNFNLIAMSRWMDLIRVIYGEETEQLRVCFDKADDMLQPYLDSLFGPPLEDQDFTDGFVLESVLYELGRFLRYVGESRGFMVSVPGMRQVYDDLALLQAFLIDLPQQFLKNGRLMEHIVFVAYRVEWTISIYNPWKEMDQQKALKLVKSLKSLFKVMSHWMDLIRIIYGKQPQAPPPVYCFVDNLAPLDAVLDYYFELMLNDNSWIKDNIERFVLLRAILMDPPPQKLIEDDTLKEFEFFAREVGFLVSSIDLNSMDYDMEDRFRDWLTHISSGPGNLFVRLESKVKETYAARPKPSRMYYPKTAQLDFVDLLADNLGELLLKAKADNASLIRLLRFDILFLQRKLQEVSRCLKKIPEPRKQEADLKDNITNITNLAYEAEYVIDSILLADIPIWCSMLWLHDILRELEEQLALIKMGSGDAESILQNINECYVFSEHQILPIFRNNTEINDTIEKVFNQTKNWRFVCTRSLVSSYTGRKKEVLLDLLRNAKIDAENDEINDEIDYSNYTSNMSKAELEESLYNLLKNKHYVVLLEDVQDIYALNDIKRVLPASLGLSNVILFTTLSSELVVQTRYGFNQISEPHPSTSQIDKLTIEKDVVGFKEETKKMLEQLIGEPKELLIISIVGSAGQGKTTLATKLFNHPSVKEYFYARAWCCVSQMYERRQLLLELLSQVVQLSEMDHHDKNDMELAVMLHKQLKGQRFLIFLDDVWKINAWNDLARCFPNDKNGSRIIFTTRIRELACQAKSRSILQPLDLLSDDESWELLQKKLNLNDCCPIRLLEVGRQIAKNCKGLPLSVVLIAGLLAKMEKKVEHWKYIAKSLNSLINAQGRGVIELSYNHLPDYLKSCFLYFGIFLEDREVQASNLIRLWIGEGFVKRSDSKSLEDVAKDYLRDLVGRSLVTIAQEKSNDGVKSCRIHDLLREFCVTQARKENFLQVLNGYDEQYVSFDDIDPSNSSSPKTIKYHLRRLCIYPKRNHFPMLKPFGPFVRSLFFVASDICPNYSSKISSIFHNFKFLKTLNLEGIGIGDSFKEICALILLRYLACQSDVDLIPSSIANLWNLQTFVFKGSGAEVVNVSDSLWDMKKLRHLHISESASFDLGPDRLENSSILDNLQTFSTPSLACGDDTEKMLRRIQSIRKLKCVFLDSCDEFIKCNQFPKLGFLSQLVSLNVIYNGKAKYPCKFYFPSNLKKLTLSNFRMPWNEISQLAQLCELEVLKLLDNAFEGETWEMGDVVFSKLKFLKLDTLNVVEWSATNDSFPILRCLVIHNCKQLQDIPLEIGEIPTLQMIEAMWCSPSVAIAAKKIEVDQQDYGNEGLTIYVHPQLCDIESLSGSE